MAEQKRKRELNSKIGIFLFWLAVWQLLSWCVGNEILFAGPLDTARALARGLRETDFYLTILYSLCRIGGGFLLGFIAGCLLGALGYRFKFLREVLAPAMIFLKSVPVASFVVLLLIWWGSKRLSVAVVFIVVLPIIYTNVVQGLLATEPKMLEMAKVFQMSRWNRFFYIYRPALKPFMSSALTISLGMSWKSGVAAEVIGTPAFSIGEQMYMAKIYLDTADLFAWTIVVILISYLFEKLGIYLWHRFCQWRPSCVATPNMSATQSMTVERNLTEEQRGSVDQTIHDETELTFSNICKSFDGKEVLCSISKELKAGKIYCLMAPSGAGKTTLLRILAGAEQADGGEIFLGKRADTARRVETKQSPVSMVFQEDRLAEDYSPLDNMAMVLGSKRKAEAEEHLKQLLPEDALCQPCRTLSGGMKRRVSLVRAMLADSRFLLLDEPFAGLDADNKEKAIKYILNNQRDRLIIVATHDETDIESLGGELWKM